MSIFINRQKISTMSRIKKVQDYLCEVEDYLKRTLQDEKLTTAAQIKRRHLLDRFYALELQANDDRNPLGSTVTHNRPIASTTTTAASSSSSSSSSLPHQVGRSENDVSGIKPEHNNNNDRQQEESVYNLYEEPVIYSKLEDDEDDDSSAIPQASFAQAEDCSDTEYESFDEEDNVDLAKTNAISHHDNRTNRDLPLPQARKASGNELNLLSRLPNVQHSGHLYQKGLLSWLKRFCIISDARLLTFRSRKHMRPLNVLDLIGCDIESVVRENSKYKYALKISRPTQGEGQPLSNSIHSAVNNSSSIVNNSSSSTIGGGAETSYCSLYSADKQTIDGWMLRLCLSGCLKTTTDVIVENTTEIVSTDMDSGVCASTCDNQASISGGSSEGGSGDGVMSAGSTGLERKPSIGSSTGVGIALKKKLKIGESLQSLIWGQFGKSRKDDKDDRIRRAFIEAGGLDAEVTHLAGYININSMLSHEGLGHWVKKFCVGRQGRLDCYKDPLDENVEFCVPLKNSVVIDGDRQTKRICLSCEMSTNRERVEVNLELFNSNDFNKWLVLVYKESDRDSMAEGVYNEVYDWKVYNVPMECQPPPLPKERPHSKLLSSSQSDCDVQTASNNNNIYEPYAVKGLSSIAEDSFLAADFIHKDDSFHLEEIMASAFDDIKRNLYEVKNTPSKDVTNVKPLTPSSKPLLPPHSSPTSRSLASSLASSPATKQSFSPVVSSSPIQDVARSRGEYKSPRCPLLMTLTSSSSSVSTSTSKMASPPRPSPPLKYRPPDAVNKISADPSKMTIKSNHTNKNGVRSSSVPRTIPSPSASNANRIYAAPSSLVNLKPMSNIGPKVTTTTTNRNSLVQSSFDFSLIKNELNKRHSVINYNLNSTDASMTTSKPFSINTSQINNNNNYPNQSRNNNLYSRPEKVAGSFITGHEPAKVQTSRSTSNSAASKVTQTPTTSPSSSIVISTHGEANPTSITSCTIHGSSMSMVSKALAAKISASSNSMMTSICNTSTTSSSLSSSSPSLPSLSSSAMTKLTSRTASPILSTVVTKRTKPTDLRVVAASNRSEAANYDLTSKRASLVALTALSSSNSKLREARAEIRKSSLELMSILPNTSNKMAVEKTFSAPGTTTSSNHVSS